jgi:hypothetical protein
MTQEMILVASIVLGVFLVPSLITVRPSYKYDEDAASPSLGSQPTE